MSVEAISAPRGAHAAHGAECTLEGAPPALPPPSDLVSTLHYLQVLKRHAAAEEGANRSSSARAEQEKAHDEAREAALRAEREAHAAHEASKASSFWGRVADVALSAVAMLPAGGAGLTTAAVVGIAGVALSVFADEIGGGDLARYGGAALAVGAGYFVAQDRNDLGRGGQGSLELAGRAVAFETRRRHINHGLDAAAHRESSAHARADATEARNRADVALQDFEDAIDLVRVAEEAARRGVNAILDIAKQVETSQKFVLGKIGRV